MKLVAFRPSHLCGLREQVEPGTWVPETVRDGIAFSLFEGNRILGCVGLVPVSGHVEAWAVLSQAVLSHPMALHRMALRGLRALDTHWPQRVVAVAQIDSRTSQKWLERLGFVPIGEDARWVFFERNTETTESNGDDH